MPSSLRVKFDVMVELMPGWEVAVTVQPNEKVSNVIARITEVLQAQPNRLRSSGKSLPSPLRLRLEVAGHELLPTEIIGDVLHEDLRAKLIWQEENQK